MLVTHVSKRTLFAATTLTMATLSSAMAVPLIFAQYIQVNGAEQQWNVSNTGTSTTVSASGAVYIPFSGVTRLPFSGPERATFTFSAATDQLGNCGTICGPRDSFVQPGYAGTFSFIDAGALPGANLLSGTFAVTASPSTTGGQFSSSIGSSGGSFNSSSTAGNLGQLVLTSQYLTFVNGTEENASWSLSSLIPNFSTAAVVGGHQAFPGPEFDAFGAGTFSVTTPPTVVIEPSSLGLAGVGLLGLGVIYNRKRRRA